MLERRVAQPRQVPEHVVRQPGWSATAGGEGRQPPRADEPRPAGGSRSTTRSGASPARTTFAGGGSSRYLTASVSSGVIVTASRSPIARTRDTRHQAAEATNGEEVGDGEERTRTSASGFHDHAYGSTRRYANETRV